MQSQPGGGPPVELDMALISGAGQEPPTVRSSILSLECFKDQLLIVAASTGDCTQAPQSFHLRASMVLSTPATLFLPCLRSEPTQESPSNLVESRLAPKTQNSNC